MGCKNNVVIRKKRVADTWKLNILGDGYEPPQRSQASCATTGDPKVVVVTDRRAHWVRGHYHMQVYGPQNSLRKRIWIDRYGQNDVAFEESRRRRQRFLGRARRYEDS
jgi:hypothetical protein